MISNNHIPGILYVEDDESLALITKHNLEKSGYCVTHCLDGIAAWNAFNKNKFQLCILDVMLPRMSGFTLALKIRAVNPDIPVIFLTAKSLMEDKISGLQTGADDYLTKPFSYIELDLKIKIFLKRPVINLEENPLVKISSFSFDFDNLLLFNELENHQLTLKEAELLNYLYQRKNKVLKREEILIGVWGNTDYFVGRSLDVFISRLRKYLGKEDNIKIENIHGVGFKMVVKQNNTN